MTEWTLSTDLAMHIMAIYPKVDGPRAEGRFRNHHRGRGTRSSSWDAEFLNWVGQDADRIGEHSEGGTDYRGVPNDTKGQWNALLMGRPTTGDQQ